MVPRPSISLVSPCSYPFGYRNTTVIFISQRSGFFSAAQTFTVRQISFATGRSVKFLWPTPPLTGFDFSSNGVLSSHQTFSPFTKVAERFCMFTAIPPAHVPKQFLLRGIFQWNHRDPDARI